jgi:hypothetical protein
VQNELVSYSIKRTVPSVEIKQLMQNDPSGVTPTISGPQDLCSCLRSLRMSGFNIPLNIVQALMGRKQIFPTLLNENSIKKDMILLRGSQVFFDLDETLILLGKPIEAVVNFLESCNLSGRSCFLVTRHVHNISDTLMSIGVRQDLFKLIYRVSSLEKKGDVLLELGSVSDDLFIDNEFPERLDARRKTGMNVIDVNQVEFVKLV